MVRDRVCELCGAAFIDKSDRRKYCYDGCSRIANLNSIVAWRKEHPGSVGASYIRYNASEKYKQAQERYQPTDKRKQAQGRYNASPKGRGVKAKGRAMRRARSTNPLLYGLRIQELHQERQRCEDCGCPYKTTNQIDHIQALALGGRDERGNLQVLCTDCHLRKTKEDIKEICRLKREGVTYD